MRALLIAAVVLAGCASDPDLTAPAAVSAETAAPQADTPTETTSVEAASDVDTGSPNSSTTVSETSGEGGPSEDGYDPGEGQALMTPPEGHWSRTIDTFWASLQEAIHSGNDSRVLDHFHYPVTYNGEVMDRETFARSDGGRLFTDDEHVRQAILDMPRSEIEGRAGDYHYSIGVEAPIPGEDYVDEYGVYGQIQTLQGALSITTVGIVG